MLRSSRPDWTSGIGKRGLRRFGSVHGRDSSRLRAGLRVTQAAGLASASLRRGPNRACTAAAIPRHRGRSPRAAPPDRRGRGSASGNPSVQQRDRRSPRRPAPRRPRCRRRRTTTFSSMVTSASCSRASFDDELDVERLDEAHVGDRRVELLRRGERRVQHAAEREERDAAAAPRAGAADLALADRQRRHRRRRRRRRDPRRADSGPRRACRA